MNRRIKLAVTLTAASVLLSAAATLFLFWPTAHAEGTTALPVSLPGDAYGWGFLGAALATGLSALGAGIAVANVGAAAVGAIAEKPELLGRVLILVGLAEGIAIYGLIVSILILNRLGG